MENQNLVGYARVSTDDQKLDLQINALIKAGVSENLIFQEHISGVKENRPEFKRALKHLREGDVLVVWKLDRLGRNLEELVKLIKDFTKRGIELKSLTEGIDTTTAMGKFFYHIMAALAQFERDLISERTIAGLEAAKVRGTYRPRKSSISRDQWVFMLGAVANDRKISASRLCRLPGMPKYKRKIPKRTTLMNYMDALRDGQEYPFVN